VSDPLSVERPYLWAVAYRLLGDAAEADEVVQEAFLRALERPPSDLARPWRPWLVRVVANLGRDRLRARRRRGWVGPWLPSPVPDELLDEGPGVEGRYSSAESASLAFLLALEALTPTQRAVVVLREVFELDAQATAEALDSTEGAVRVQHHRARAALAAYDATRAPAPDRGEAMAVYSAFLWAVQSGDVDGARRLVTDDATVYSDGGGRFRAARVPVVGGDKVARFCIGLHRLGPTELRWRAGFYNGLPALVGAPIAPEPGHAALWVMAGQLREGRVWRIYTVLVPEKLVRVEPPGADEP